MKLITKDTPFMPTTPVFYQSSEDGSKFIYQLLNSPVSFYKAPNGLTLGFLAESPGTIEVAFSIHFLGTIGQVLVYRLGVWYGMLVAVSLWAWSEKSETAQIKRRGELFDAFDLPS